MGILLLCMDKRSSSLPEMMLSAPSMAMPSSAGPSWTKKKKGVNHEPRRALMSVAAAGQTHEGKIVKLIRDAGIGWSVGEVELVLPGETILCAVVRPSRIHCLLSCCWCFAGRTTISGKASSEKGNCLG
jgi:hypothetical protein